MIRIGNASGFYGDRFSAVREMLTGGPLDVLTGDYLAELTMLILGRDRLKDPVAGYATTFLRQLEDSLGLAVERGRARWSPTRAGSTRPGWPTQLRELAAAARPRASPWPTSRATTCVVRADELGLGHPLTANAYLGALGIAECLRAGADVVVTGRVTDASLVVGPAAAHFGWRADRLRRTGRRGGGRARHRMRRRRPPAATYAVLHRDRRPRPPRASRSPRSSADGSCVITKHDGHRRCGHRRHRHRAAAVRDRRSPATPGPTSRPGSTRSS